MNIEKRIKRRIIGRRHDLFAVTLPGFEHLCRDELLNLSDTIEIKETVKGGVGFSGRLIDLYQASLHVRTAVRILMRLTSFKASNFLQIETRVRKIDWELYLPLGAIPEFSVTAHHSRLYHSQAIAGHLGKSLKAYWTELNMSSNPLESQTLFVRLKNDRVTLSLDSSGAPLYQRGLKRHAAQAPLRETTAAGILLSVGYRPEMPLIDPMCGAGTFSLEAALMAKKIPPGIHRSFAFMQWPAFRPRQWAYLKKEARQNRIHWQTHLIRASDSSAGACSLLQECVRDHEFNDIIKINQEDFFNMRPDRIFDQQGVVVLNPPYGRRVVPENDIDKFYQKITAKLQSDFREWRVALLVPQKAIARKLTLNLKPMTIGHGGLELVLLTGKIQSR